jgi:DHA2 family multidrug resistance protein
MICVMLFGISSACAAWRPSLPLLIFFRILQGAGGGGLAPSEQAILADTFEPKDRGKAFAIYGIAVVCAPGHRPHAGRLHHRQLRLALDLLHQRPHRHHQLFLTNRIVEDPPHIVKEVKEMQKKGLNLDFFGFILLAIGFGSLEFVLDKGQEDDWFGSRIITTFIVLCVTRWSPDPLGDAPDPRPQAHPRPDALQAAQLRHLLHADVRARLLPLRLHGAHPAVRAIDARLHRGAGRPGHQSPAARHHPAHASGRLPGRQGGRAFPVAYGFFPARSRSSAMLNLNLDVSYSYVAWLRVFQASGLAFLFVPISTISFAGVPPGKNNDASGLTNLARNIGGSVGTAFLVTVLARRAQYHQQRLGDHLTADHGLHAERGRAHVPLSARQRRHGLFAAQGRGMAQGTVMRQLILHSTMLAYLDVIKCFAIAMGMMVPRRLSDDQSQRRPRRRRPLTVSA